MPARIWGALILLAAAFFWNAAAQRPATFLMPRALADQEGLFVDPTPEALASDEEDEEQAIMQEQLSFEVDPLGPHDGDAAIRLRGRLAASSVDAEAAQRIDRVLDSPLKAPLDFPQTPLNIVAQEIADVYEVPILWDKAALEQSAISSEIEVDISVRHLTLRAALELLLGQVDGLTYVVDHQVLLITTHEAAESQLEIRVYPVQDLADPHHKHPYKSLGSMIVSAVETDSWAANKRGQGQLVVMPQGLLVVANTQRVHRQVEAALTALRAALTNASAPGSGGGF